MKNPSRVLLPLAFVACSLFANATWATFGTRGQGSRPVVICKVLSATSRRESFHKVGEMVTGLHHVVAKQTPSIIVEGTFSGVFTGRAASSEEPLALRFASNTTSLERAVRTNSFQLPREIPLDHEHMSAQFLNYPKDLFVRHFIHPFTREEGDTP